MSVRTHQKIIIIVQARMGSTRLPGKSLKPILDKPMLGYLLDRLKRVDLADSVVVATTYKPEDQAIEDFCKTQKVRCYRGSESDVLGRYKEAADLSKATIIIRISGDCPLMDPDIVSQVIQGYLALNHDLDYVSNTLERTYPRGMDVELFTKSALDRAFSEAKEIEEREHVTPYIYRHPDLFRLENISAEKDLSNFRLTVDTSEDFELISLILKELYPKNPQFDLYDILKLLFQHPEWVSINADVKQKSLNEQ